MVHADQGHADRRLLERGPEPLLALPQRLLGPLPPGHVPEVHREAVRGRVGVDLIPAVVRRVERLERDGDVLVHRPAIGVVELGPHGGGEFLPQVLAEQVVLGAAQQCLGLPVDVGEPPVPPHGVEGIGDALQDRPGLLPGPSDLRLGPPPLADVPEDQDGPDDPPGRVPDRGGAVVDGPLGAVPGDQERVVGQADDHALPQRPEGGVLDLPAGLLVDDAEDRGEGLARRLGGGPARERLGDRVQRRDPALGVGDEDGIADAGEGGPQLLPLPDGLVGVGLGPPPCGSHRPAQEGDAQADRQVEGHPGLVLDPLDGEAVPRRQEEAGRGDGPEDGRQQGGATAAVAGDDEDGEEQRGEGEQVAQQRVEGQAGDRRQDDHDDGGPVAEHLGAWITVHGDPGSRRTPVGDRRADHHGLFGERSRDDYNETVMRPLPQELGAVAAMDSPAWPSPRRVAARRAPL